MVACPPPSIGEIHPAIIAAVTENAERQAIMVAEILRVLDPRLKQDGHPTGANGFPPGFLLEMGAICQLKVWELKGLRPFLPSDLPTSAEASEDLHRRAIESPREFHSHESARLRSMVLHVWLNRFAWAAPNLLQAEVVLGEVDEDALVEAIARLLWDHRHDAANQLMQPE